MSQQKTYQTARGVRDILPVDQKYWRFFRCVSEKVLSSLGIERIDLPHFENVEIFSRGLGEATDVVQKGMFTIESNSYCFLNGGWIIFKFLIFEMFNINIPVEPVIRLLNIALYFGDFSKW